jgi:hypothetical protein
MGLSLRVLSDAVLQINLLVVQMGAKLATAYHQIVDLHLRNIGRTKTKVVCCSLQSMVLLFSTNQVRDRSIDEAKKQKSSVHYIVQLSVHSCDIYVETSSSGSYASRTTDNMTVAWGTTDRDSDTANAANFELP